MKHAAGPLLGIIITILIAFNSYPKRVPEIALTIGEPWENMRLRSSAKIGPITPGTMWYAVPKSDASLRLVDPVFGFATPAARFFTISYEKDESISIVQMSPQIEPLTIDETMKVLLELQQQWQRNGWQPIWPEEYPPFTDTATLRGKLRNSPVGIGTYWEAKGKYEIMIYAHRFQDEQHPTKECYLITLELTAPIRALMEDR